MKKSVLAFLFIIVLTLSPVIVESATIYLSNGDRISGTIQTFDDSKVVLTSAFGNKITVGRTNVVGLSSDKPLTVRFTNGEYLTGSVRFVEEGTLQLTNAEGDVTKTFSPEEVEVAFTGDPREALRDKLEVKLSGSINGGVNKTEGNTNQESYYFDGSVRARTPQNRYTIGFEYNQEQTSDVLTEENALFFGKYDHFLKDQWYFFTSTTLKQDTFKNLSLRSSISLGIGKQIYETSEQFLLAEIGAGYTNESYEDNTPSISYFGARYSIDYERSLNYGTRFFHFQEGLIGTGDDGDFTFRSQTGFKFPMVAGLQSKLQFNLDWDQEPTAGNVSTDREYLFTLGYSF